MSPPNFLEDDVSLSASDHRVHRFEYRCPPGGERRVVLYLTSLRGIRKTYDNCRQLKLLLKAFGVAIDERDVALHSGFRKELEDLLGQPLPVPRLFIKGLYVGGAEDVARLHEEGRLVSLLPEFRLARQMSWNPEYCQGCGGMRFYGSLEHIQEAVFCCDCLQQLASLRMESECHCALIHVVQQLVSCTSVVNSLLHFKKRLNVVTMPLYFS
ncbi:hypothetical protein R1flu_019591 [Riccia fluitans]|uniref:Glutaredoxin domain-containing protein n=1 Tax=Riccia fluitans TaxID=41844 RepID=A0ABD1ZJ36_9MARC